MQPPFKVVAHCSPFLGWGLNDTLCRISLCKGVSCTDVVHVEGASKTYLYLSDVGRRKPEDDPLCKIC